MGNNLVDDGDFSELDVPRNVKVQKVAFLTQAGDMQKLSFVVGFKELAETFNFSRLLSRHDFDVDAEDTPGNRDISPGHVKKIAEGIRSSERPYVGTLTVALDGKHVDVKPLSDISETVKLVKFTIYEDAPNPFLEDGQHRVAMAAAIWPEVRDATEGKDAITRARLEKTSVEVTMLLEGERDVLSTIFVRMGSTKPISQSLIAVMDSSTWQNRLGQYFMRHSRLLEDRVAYLGAAAAKELAASKGRAFDNIYAAAAVRSAAASMAGVGVRDRTPESREQVLDAIFTKYAKDRGVTEEQAMEKLGSHFVGLLDYAYATLPGWRELKKGSLTAAQFKKEYVHSANVGLHVVANVIAAAEAAGLDPRLAIDAMASVPWRKSDLRDAKDENGDVIKVHTFFEHSLVKTRFDASSGAWVAGTAGATRSAYEPAIEKVLRHVAQADPSLADIASLGTMRQVGLKAAKAGRGRPKKAAA